MSRSYSTSRPLAVSGYGRSPPTKGSQTVDAVPGGQVPEYTGPSITEKRKGRSENIESHSNEMKSKRDAEFADSMFEPPKPLSKNGSDWDGKIHQTGSYRSNQDSEHDTTGKPKKKPTKLPGSTGKEDLGKSKRSISSKTSRNVDDRRDPNWQEQRDRELWKEDLKDDANRMKEKAQNKLHKAKLATEDVGVDLKEGAQKLWHKTKKMARNVKETVADATKGAMAPMYEDNAFKPGSNKPVKDLYPTSDSEGAKQGVKLPMASPEAAAEASGASLGEDVDAVRKSLFDGPQDMPQGVGKRAKNQEGEPMETGTRGS